MSRLLRMTYGHGGTRLGKVLVAAPAMEPPDPRWLKLLFLTAWIAVPLLICRFSLPPMLPRTATVIDTSRLAPRPVPESPIVKEPPKPVPAPVQAAPKPPAEAAPPAIMRPAITLPAPARAADAPEYQPRIARQRLQPGADNGPAPDTRIRREPAATQAPYERTTIARTRGAAVPDLPAAPERRPSMRRAASAEGPLEGGSAPLRPVTRRAHPADTAAAGPRVATLRDRREPGGTGAEQGSGEVGLARGVSLASLDICSSDQAEEDAVRSVLGVVGSRHSCRDATGEYQFTGTRRVSSFNLIIRPARGRRPTNRCEELEHAYSCLTTH